MEGLGEGGTTRWTTVLGESGQARTETNLSQVVEIMKGGSPKRGGPRESESFVGFPMGLRHSPSRLGTELGMVKEGSPGVET